ncbi:hypothetical protein IJ384_06485 [bacterium]|nr:hypothetical protein [bacterium]
MNKLPRKPNVENRYSLTIKDIKALKVGNRELVGPPLFWWNNVISAWCILGVAGPCRENEFWIGIYTEDAPKYKGKFRFSITCFGGMCSYNFNKFFQPNDIEDEYDLIIQEKFLDKINELLDKGILVRS